MPAYIIIWGILAGFGLLFTSIVGAWVQIEIYPALHWRWFVKLFCWIVGFLFIALLFALDLKKEKTAKGERWAFCNAWFLVAMFMICFLIRQYWPIVKSVPSSPITITNSVYIAAANCSINPVWHLKLTGLQYVPKESGIDKVPAFRIVADVNGLECSFPNETMFYPNLTTNRQEAQGDACLPFGDNYKINFHAIIIPDVSVRGMLELAKSLRAVQSGFPYVQTNMPVPTVHGRSDSFEAANLPSSGTNEISIRVPGDSQMNQFYGSFRIFYEISSK